MHEQNKSAVDKSVMTEIGTAATKMKDGYISLWNPAKNLTPPTPPKAGTRAARKGADAAEALKTSNTAGAAKQTAQGKDVGTMLGTTSGKVATGTLGAMGASKVNNAMKNKKNAGLTYAPDSVAYGKADEASFEGTFSKFDDDKHLAFGWASVVTQGGHPVVDKQGDYINIEDIEKAAYAYVEKSRVGGDTHRRVATAAHWDPHPQGPNSMALHKADGPDKVSEMVESMVFTDDKVEKMGLPDDFPRGWWVGFKIKDEDTWSEVRKGNRTGFSIHGKGIRKSQSLDEIMGY
jgi:hypothetical protein